VLLIRTRAKHFEPPKGHVEPGETHARAAARELCEETGLRASPPVGRCVGELVYHFDGVPPVHKRVVYYAFDAADDALAFGPLPRGTRERCWVHAHELSDLPLRSENLRPLLAAFFRDCRQGVAPR
jgi:8-oxo-dGTP pyrophosphatase MutT (NUDIX family)